jgi:hypothetical protein
VPACQNTAVRIKNRDFGLNGQIEWGPLNYKLMKEWRCEVRGGEIWFGMKQRFSTFWYSRTPKPKIISALDNSG